MTDAPAQRNSKRVDRLRAIELKQHGASYSEIAQLQGVSPQAIHKAIKDLLPTEHTETYKKDRADILAEMQRKLLSEVDDDRLKKTPVGSLVLAACQLYDKERLERGQSTDNVAVVLFQMPEPDGVPVSIQSVDNPVDATTYQPHGGENSKES